MLDSHRRSLLQRSDQLLGQVEDLALIDRPSLPDPLRAEIDRLARVLPLPLPPAPMRTVAAHDHILRLQHQLLCVQRPAGGCSRVTTRLGPSLPLLALPEDPGLHHDMVERALHRWDRLRGIAATVARRGDRAAAARVWAMAEVAWTNLVQLREAARRRAA